LLSAINWMLQLDKSFSVPFGMNIMLYVYVYIGFLVASMRTVDLFPFNYCMVLSSRYSSKSMNC
jgi:hypothetical protein